MISKDILPRAMTAVVSRALEIFPVVVLTGARQTGKSTLAKDLAPLSHRRWPDIAHAQTVATESWQELALRGGYPQAVLLCSGPQANAARNEIFSGYTSRAPGSFLH